MLGKRLRAIAGIALALLKDVRGGVTKSIVGIAVALLVIGALLPTAIIKVSNATAYGSTVDASVKTIAVVVLPMLAVIAIALKFLGKRV